MPNRESRASGFKKGNATLKKSAFPKEACWGEGENVDS